MSQLYVFGYGSLLNPTSLARSVPGVDVGTCVPGRCDGYVRAMSVAFPNDGSQGDKAYYDQRGERPPVVLFWDIAFRAGRQVNGICIPVGDDGYAALEARELRYDPADVTDHVTPIEGATPLTGRVVAFVGKPEFTRRSDVARGVIPRAYLEGTVEGAAYWERTSPGFLAEFWQGTEDVEASRVRSLTRVDRPGG